MGNNSLFVNTKNTKGYFIVGIVLLVLITTGLKGEPEKVTPYEFPTIGYFPDMPINTDNLVSVEGRELGRMLFYDPILSQDSTISCASCHQQKFAFSDGDLTFSVGINGALTKRNTPALYNLAWYEAMFWDGRAESIESQVFEPVRSHDEMNLSWTIAEDRIKNHPIYPQLFNQAFPNSTIDSITIAKAIAQFERTLISNNAGFDRVLRGEAYLNAQEYAGYELMNDQSKGNCLHCHSTDGNGLGTTGTFSNNGLDTAKSAAGFIDQGKGGITGLDRDMGAFKIPSLRNVAITAPYMHDGRFSTLREVLDFYATGLQPSYSVDSKLANVHRGGNHLTDEEKEQIIAFLETLTDSVFINDPRHGNPFLTGRP